MPDRELVSRPAPSPTASRAPASAWSPRAALWQAVLLIGAALVLLGAAASTASAHMALETSQPQSGQVLTRAPATVTLTFGERGTPVGTGIKLLDGSGATVPAVVTPASGTTFTVTPSSVLTAGEYAVSFRVRSDDGHTEVGSVTFRVASSSGGSSETTAGPVRLVSSTPTARATGIAPPARVALRFSAPVELTGSGLRLLNADGGEIAASVSQDGQVFTLTPEAPLSGGHHGVTWRLVDAEGEEVFGSTWFHVGAGHSEGMVAPGGDGMEGGSDGMGMGSESDLMELPDALASALEPPDDTAALIVRDIGMAALYLGLILGLGTLIFTRYAMVGSAAEVRTQFRIVRIGGVAIAIGALVAALGSLWEQAGEWSSTFTTATLDSYLTSQAGLAMLLAFAGGVLVAAGAVGRDAPVDPIPGVTVAPPDGAPVRGALGAAWIALVGIAVAIAGLAIDGHSGEVTPQWLMLLTDVLHIIVVAAWAAAVVLIAMLALRRSAAGQPAGTGAMVIRFANMATVLIALMVVTGVVLAVLILPSASALVTTAWGLVLIAKVALVLCALAIGAHAHYKVVPQLRASVADGVSGPDPALVRALGRATAVEGVLLIAVIALAAVLVGLSPMS